MTDNTIDAGELDRRHTLRPWTNFGALDRQSFVVTHGKGTRLWDDRGRSYLDAVGGLWCTNIGLGREDMVQAIADQTRKLAYSSTFVDMTTDPTARLSAKIAEISPEGFNHTHFTPGGSEALDSAYRLVGYAQACMGRPEKRHMIARENAYHGATYIAASLGKRKGDRAPEFSFETNFIHHISSPYTYRRPEGQSEAEFSASLVAEFEAKIAEIGPDKVGGFFAEPIQASGGVLVPPDGYLRAMKAVCDKHDILFVADEVVTAFGRLGHWFASRDVFDITPDIICTAKGLSSGYQPIGAMLIHDRVWEAMQNDPERWYTSGFTYSGHPVACAAALKNLEIIEGEGLLERTRELGPYLQDRMSQLRDLPLVGNTRGMGLMACIENVANKETKDLLPDDLDVGSRITFAAEDLGLMVRPLGHLNVMSPSLTITEGEIEFIGETLTKAITKVADDLTREGWKIN